MVNAVTRKQHVMLVGHLAGRELFGAERSLLDLLECIDKEQYEVSCILPSTNDGYINAIAKFTNNIIVFPYSWWSSAQPVHEGSVSRFAAIFAREHVDLVHVNTITLMDPLLAARRVSIPSIVHARELINEDEQLAHVFGGSVAGIVSKVQSATDFIICNSDATHRLYHMGDRSFRLYNTLDFQRLDITNELEPGRLKVGIVSSNLQKKGIEHFANLAQLALHCCPTVEFFVIGPLNEYATDLKRRGPRPNLHFLGYFDDPTRAVQSVVLHRAANIAKPNVSDDAKPSKLRPVR